MKELILASASPRRKEILSTYRDDFRIVVTDADETMPEGTPPDILVAALSERKARAAQPLCGEDAVIIASDTVVYAEGEVLGKPHDGEDARRMLKMLRGATHEVWSGVCVISGDKCSVGAECTKVKMGDISDLSIERYIADGEPFGKAGAYAIQGKAGVFVTAIEGSFQNVVGLPIVTLDRLLREVGEEGLI